MQRAIPYNFEAEVALLGCILLDDTLVKIAIDQIGYDDFYDDRNKEIFKAFIQMHIDEINIDITTLITYLSNSNLIEKAGGLNHLNTLSASTYSTYNVDSYIDLVKEASIKRHAIWALEELSSKGYQFNGSANEYMEVIESKIYELSKRGKAKSFHRIDQVTKLVREITEAKNKQDSELTGLDTGFTNLNSVTYGLQKESLIILAARPGMGKSVFAMNLALNVAQNSPMRKGVVAVFSLEMGNEQLVERMIASDAKIPLGLLKTGQLKGNDWHRFHASTNKLDKLNIYFDESSSVTVGDVRNKCRKLQNDIGLDFIIIDYLQLMMVDEKGKTKLEEVSYISRALKLLARELKVPVLALSQMSRASSNRPDKTPMMSDLRDSGTIEQDADIVMFIHREEVYKAGTRPGEADLIICKNRSGESDVTLNYLFQGQFSTFVDRGRASFNSNKVN